MVEALDKLRQHTIEQRNSRSRDRLYFETVRTRSS